MHPGAVFYRLLWCRTAAALSRYIIGKNTNERGEYLQNLTPVGWVDWWGDDPAANSLMLSPEAAFIKCSFLDRRSCRNIDAVKDKNLPCCTATAMLYLEERAGDRRKRNEKLPGKSCVNWNGRSKNITPPMVLKCLSSDAAVYSGNVNVISMTEFPGGL